MRISTLIGILLGIAAILGAFYIEGGDFTKLFLVAPMLIVIGGTLMAGLASSSWNIFKNMFKLMGIAFYPPQYNKKEISFQILEYSLITRKSGMLAIEDKVNAAKHPYIKKIFQAGIDGADANALEELFMLEIEGINNRHNENTGFFQKLGGLSPTMGIIGTVMGLISTMGSASENGDADVLIYNISIAFLATLWGIAMANLVWIPIADKLQFVHNEEVEVLELIFEGAKSVVSGESTLVISSKLSSMLPFSAQMQFNREAKSFIESRRQTLQQTKTT